MTFKGLASVGPPFFIGIIAKAPRLPEFFGNRGVIFLLLFCLLTWKTKALKDHWGNFYRKFHAKYSLRLERPPALFSHKRLIYKQRAGEKYLDNGFVVTNEFGHYFEQKTFKDYYDRLLKDADIGHFTFHALRHTFATRALERGMDYKTLSAILGHYSVAFTMDTYVHSMDEHKRREMDKIDDMFGMQYSIFVENQPYPVLCTLSPDGCTAHVPDFPKIVITASTLDAALLEVKQQIQKALRQYKNPPIPTKQDQIVVPTNSVLVLVKAE